MIKRFMSYGLSLEQIHWSQVRELAAKNNINRSELFRRLITDAYNSQIASKSKIRLPSPVGYLTVKRVAKDLDLTTQAIRTWIQKGSFPYEKQFGDGKYGFRYLIPQDAYLKWIQGSKYKHNIDKHLKNQSRKTNKSYLTMIEISKDMGIVVSTIHAWIKSGKLPAQKKEKKSSKYGWHFVIPRNIYDKWKKEVVWKRSKHRIAAVVEPKSEVQTLELDLDENLVNLYDNYLDEEPFDA